MYYVCHLLLTEISHLPSLSVRAIRNLLENHCQTGHVKSSQPKAREGILSDDEIQPQFIEGCLEHSPDAYLDELQVQLQEAMGRQCIEDDNQWCTEETKLHVQEGLDQDMTLNNLYSVDESAFDRRTAYRRYGWAVKGRRAHRTSFYVRGKR
ncbi:hypothetical protein BKA82DRAFT_4016098 [Pisolithus tinctorius]|nr:hypothetical protein BKA82DRAFT_4016098 [Pisolithus tinctorius]